MAKLLDLSVYGPGHISNILQVDASVYAMAFITNGGNNTQVVRGDGTLASISSLSVGNADTVDNKHASDFALLKTWNDLIHSGNEFTFVSPGYAGAVWFNYRTSSGKTDGSINQYSFGDGKGGSLAYISNGYFSGKAESAKTADTASAATTATTLYTNNTAQDASSCYDGSPGLHFYRFNGTGNNIGGGDGFILQWSWNPGSVGGQIYLDDNPSKVAAIRGYDNGTKTFTSWSKFIHSDNYTEYVNTTNFPGLNKVGTVTSVTVTGANGVSGSGTITTSGTITLSNSGVRSTTINGDYLRVNTNGTNADLTIPAATKLYNKRKIWNNEFDGTADVTGVPKFSPHKNTATTITDAVASVIVSSNGSGYTGYHTGISFRALGGHSETYANHTHAWIGLGKYTTTATAECYPLVFATNDSTTTNTAPTERMRIIPAGNVGIATDNPTYTLTVNGTFGVTGASTFTGKTTHNGGIGTTFVTATGNVSAGGNLSVTGTSTFTGKTTHNGGIGTTFISTSGDVSIGGNLSVTGTSTFTGKTTHNGGIDIADTKTIRLRTNSSWLSGIGYDTNGNECLALWAKNSVTRLRWYAGKDMSTMSSGTMMGITPDFEISKASGTALGYIGGNLIWTAGTDGSNSGLDADLLDGVHSYAFKKTWEAHAGKTYIGWVTIAKWTVSTASHFSPQPFMLSIYRSYNSPAPESYTFSITFGWDTATIIQISGNAKNRIIEKLRIGKCTDALTYKLEMYVNTSYTTYDNTCYCIAYGYLNDNFSATTTCELTNAVSSTVVEVTTSSGTIVGNVIGNLTGNASSATKLETSRTIWGQSFNGTANVSGNLTLGSYGMLGYGSSIASKFLDSAAPSPEANAVWLATTGGGGEAAGIMLDGNTIKMWAPLDNPAQIIDSDDGTAYNLYHTGYKPSKSDVGLGNVDNTADANKSVNYANSAGSASNADKLDNLDSTAFMRAVSDGSYYGMQDPAASTSNWIRTTSSGLIPYSSGGASSLGTSSWPFSNAYINSIYGTLYGKLVATSGGAGSTSISYANAAIMVGTVNRSGTAGSYYPGIAFNHMYTYSSGSTYRNHAHAWIGLKLHSTPAAELSYLVFATNGDSTNGTSPVERMSIAPDGNISCTNNVTAAAFYESSDIRLKQNIKQLFTSSNIPQIKEFDWKESGKHSYGLIAQELESMGYTELVDIKDDGYKSVNYTAAHSLIIGKLQLKIKELEDRIKYLESK
jgi:hypothetical protein